MAAPGNETLCLELGGLLRVPGLSPHRPGLTAALPGQAELSEMITSLHVICKLRSWDLKCLLKGRSCRLDFTIRSKAKQPASTQRNGVRGGGKEGGEVRRSWEGGPVGVLSVCRWGATASTTSVLTIVFCGKENTSGYSIYRDQEVNRRQPLTKRV